MVRKTLDKLTKFLWAGINPAATKGVEIYCRFSTNVAALCHFLLSVFRIPHSNFDSPELVEGRIRDTLYRFFIAPKATTYASTAKPATNGIPKLIAAWAATMALSTDAHPFTDQA